MNAIQGLRFVQKIKPKNGTVFVVRQYNIHNEVSIFFIDVYCISNLAKFFMLKLKLLSVLYLSTEPWKGHRSVFLAFFYLVTPR